MPTAVNKRLSFASSMLMCIALIGCGPRVETLNQKVDSFLWQAVDDLSWFRVERLTYETQDDNSVVFTMLVEDLRANRQVFWLGECVYAVGQFPESPVQQWILKRATFSMDDGTPPLSYFNFQWCKSYHSID